MLFAVAQNGASISATYSMRPLSLIYLFAFQTLVHAEPVRLRVQPDVVLAHGADRKLGLNVNYLMDNDSDWRPTAKSSSADAIASTGSRWLRFPGGEKSDAYLWSRPPFDRPEPALARTGASEWPAGDRRFTLEDNATLRIATLGFDDYISWCRRIGAEPIIVVPLDSSYKMATEGGHAPTKAELLENACAWVRYANVVRGYGVRYWEVGNEGFLPTQNGNPPDASTYGRDTAEFARAMKAVDPTIKVGANGRGANWWRDMIVTAGADIDFLSAHDYPCWEWRRYDTYLTWNGSLTPDTDEALRAIDDHAAPADRNRLVVIATEFNAADWSKPDPWPNDNDLGHALVLIEMMGHYLVNPRVIGAQLWNTRWIENPHPTANTLWDALDHSNQLNASGLSLEIWSHTALEKMVQVSGTTDLIRAFASTSSDGRHLSVLIINKAVQQTEVELSIPLRFAQEGSRFELRTLSGQGLTDRQPTLSQASAPEHPFSGRLVLQSHSATAIIFSLDQASNLLEYALGLDPLASANATPPVIGASETEWIYTYTRPADRPDLTYAVEASPELDTWSTTGVTHERTATGSTETWQGHVPLSTGPKIFFRLRITRP